SGAIPHSDRSLLTSETHFALCPTRSKFFRPDPCRILRSIRAAPASHPAAPAFFGLLCRPQSSRTQRRWECRSAPPARLLLLERPAALWFPPRRHNTSPHTAPSTTRAPQNP